jgi:hypothetical protein
MSAIVQAATFSAAFAALFISLWQGKETARQSRESSRQSAVAAASLLQSSQQELLRRSVDIGFDVLMGNADLLAWFLASRGFPPDDVNKNRRYYFIWIRLDIHEVNYMSYRDHLMTEELWQEWLVTLRLDLRMPECALVWQFTKGIYSKDFAALVDSELPPTSAGH